MYLIVGLWLGLTVLYDAILLFNDQLLYRLCCMDYAIEANPFIITLWAILLNNKQSYKCFGIIIIIITYLTCASGYYVTKWII